MDCHIYDPVSLKRLRVEDRVPVCGEDFCDSCGDCLACSWGDCGGNDGEEHFWVVDEEKE